MLWLERNGDAIAIDVYDFFRSMQLSGLIDLHDYRTCVLEALIKWSAGGNALLLRARHYTDLA